NAFFYHARAMPKHLGPPEGKEILRFAQNDNAWSSCLVEAACGRHLVTCHVTRYTSGNDQDVRGPSHPRFVFDGKSAWIPARCGRASCAKARIHRLGDELER